MCTLHKYVYEESRNSSSNRLGENKMATLVSPGVSVTIVNDSYYIPAAAPTVPLIFLATQANKTQADGITPAAGTLEHSVVRTITSLTQSISTYGVPVFRKDSTNAPQHGDARNEYGLFALNQALTILNQAYVVRADVDLADLTTSEYVSSGPTFGGTGNGTISTPVLNQATAVAELWTVTANPGVNAVSTFSTIVPGQGYTNGIYNAVSLTPVSGTGTGATANITVAGVTSGKATIAFTATPTVAAGTALGIAAGSYSFTTNIDGAGAVTHSVTATGVDTMSSMAALMTAQLGITAVVSVVANAFVITSASTGATSTVIVTIPASTGTDLIGAINTALTATNVNVSVAGTSGVTSVVLVGGGTGYAIGNQLTGAIAGGSGFTVAVGSVTGVTFAVSGSVSNAQGNATQGLLYSNSKVSFTITAGTIPFRAADAWTFNVTQVSVSEPLGANDAARRVTIVSALNGEITSNQDVRSEIYEYNLILCPGYHETITNLLSLNDAINDEAFVIADCPFDKSPEDTVVWSLTTERQSSTNVAYYYPNALASNLDGATIFCAASGVALKTYAYSDSVSEVWYPPAGFRRGVVTGVTDIGYVKGTLGTATTFVSTPLNQGQRDSLYEYSADINPIPFFPGQGIVVFGQKTSTGALASGLDRVNVMRLMIMIKRDIRKASMSYLFELNDRITRDSIKSMIDNYLNDILQRRGLYDYVVVCDSSNNTPTRIDANQLWVDIAVQPTKSVEFIYIPINIVSTGATLG